VRNLLWSARFFMRYSHRWGALVVAIPFLVVLATGIVLQLKKIGISYNHRPKKERHSI